MSGCEQCFNDFEDFDRCDSTVIRRVLQENEVLVDLGVACQAEVNKRRDRLHQAALYQLEPIEIITVPGVTTGEIMLKVRRFAR